MINSIAMKVLTRWYGYTEKGVVKNSGGNEKDG